MNGLEMIERQVADLTASFDVLMEATDRRINYLLATIWRQRDDINQLREATRWRDAAVELPEQGVEVLVALDAHYGPSIETGGVTDGRWYAENWLTQPPPVTHWMPMPPHPGADSEA